MIAYLKKSEIHEEKLGNKGKFLLEMLKAGFPVPEGFILDSDVYDEFVLQNGLKERILARLNELGKDNIAETSKELIALFEATALSDSVRTEMEKRAKSGVLYAVRSSGILEDMAEHSFAGQYDTFLNVPREELCDRVIDCYRSMFREVILSYVVDNQIPAEALGMSVVIQEMVDADLSGICFTVDPTTGNDKEMLIEVSEGLGENLVSGRTAPQQYYFNWYDDAEAVKGEPPASRLLTEEKLTEYALCFKRIQQYFGYPCDIEFAVKDGRLYILQSRAITKLQYGFTPYVWTTADFKDGGVSATICTPYMWSLYEYIWEYSLRKFIVDSEILTDEELPPKLGEMFYGRPYWNLSAVKKALSQIIGYKEREFDNEYGIRGHYEGDGQTTGVSAKILLRMSKIIYHQTRLLNDRRRNAERYKAELLAIYDEYKKQYEERRISSMTQAYFDLTHNIYLRSETTYFWQIFLNTIHQSLYKDSLLKYVSESEYLSLLSSIDNISHLLPFYEIWELTRNIRFDVEAAGFWRDNSAEEIAKSLDGDGYFLPEARALIEKYGYHSDKELDITYPCYYEEPETLLQVIKDTALLDDSFSPEKDKERGRRTNEEILSRLEKDVSRGTYKKIVRKIGNMRRMLWWREEFRDVSTRFYYLLRIYTVKYAKSLQKKGILESWEDVWFLKVGDLWNYIEKKRTPDEFRMVKELRATVKKNKLYYNAYRNYMSENEIGSDFSLVSETPSADSLKGLGANNGRMTGTARVIHDFSEIDRLREGDILVTRFTDTGWTPKFAILSGIVTEYGGILCHAAIVSREYGIPAIVCCKDAMSRIADGQTISIDGSTGTVTLNGEQSQ
ncbi:MAG: phosphoenolpyruvate synthase [Clostridia bacterium]|nr:phosphoenolpyruvate synthase [Clostridia bacterium]